MQLTFLSEERHASHSASPGYEKDWLTRAATSCSPILPCLIAILPAGASGRMSPASYRLSLTPLPIHVHRRHRWIWDATARKWSLKTSMTQKNYTGSTASWPDFQNSGMGSPTECLTLNTSEHADTGEPFLSGGAVCSLSDILETGDVPQRYYLTAKACLGILRRAERRGKSLPPQLARALQAVADSGLASTSTGD